MAADAGAVERRLLAKVTIDTDPSVKIQTTLNARPPPSLAVSELGPEIGPRLH
jgi:hypothetical protein